MSFVKLAVLIQNLEFYCAELVPFGNIPDVFDGHLTSVLELTVSCTERSVGPSPRFGAVMALKALIVKLFFLLIFLDLLVHFRLLALYFFMKPMSVVN